ncbi:hypothetical protein Tco_0071853 [Tanacetum coccineum]
MVKPVWNNAQRVNHQNFAKKTHPCAKKNLVPRAVLMKSGLVSINTARQNISKTAVLVNTARQVNAAHSKTTVNAARPMSYLSKTTHSTVKRPIHKNTTFKNSNINQRVNTIRGKKFNTARPKAVVNAIKGNNFNAVKASTCWVWKPKHKVLDHFGSTVKAKTINGEVQLHALVDGKKIIAIESTVRRDLQLEDAEGIDCLPNSTIFEELTRMGSKTTAWNEFSSTMAYVIICLAINQKFKFSKYIFESMVKNLDNLSGKFLMYPRVDIQQKDINRLKRTKPSIGLERAWETEAKVVYILNGLTRTYFIGPGLKNALLLGFIKLMLKCMSTRSTSSNLFYPLRDPESLIRRRNFGEPSSLFNFEEVMSIPHNNQGPLPAGPFPPNNNGPPPLVRPNEQAPRSMEELCQPSINGRGGPIALIPIQEMNFGLRHHMIQQVGTYQFHGLPGHCWDLKDFMDS